MLLTISTTRQPATNLGYLLHKHPERCQMFTVTFGKRDIIDDPGPKMQCA